MSHTIAALNVLRLHASAASVVYAVLFKATSAEADCFGRRRQSADTSYRRRGDILVDRGCRL